MPISLLNFKDYCNLRLSETPATRSGGVVTVRRTDVQSQTIIPIPIHTVFSVSTGQSFQNLEIAELNQSQSFIPLFLQSVATGTSQNIPATSEWNTPIAGITLSNSDNFTGGQDAVHDSNLIGIVNSFNVPSDFILQLMLDQSQKICMGIIGNPSQTPDTPTFQAGVYFLGRYYLETRSKTGVQIENGILAEILQERKVVQGIEDKKVHEGVLRILTGMLTADRNPKAFMPEVQSGSS